MAGLPRSVIIIIKAIPITQDAIIRQLGRHRPSISKAAANEYRRYGSKNALTASVTFCPAARVSTTSLTGVLLPHLEAFRSQPDAKDLAKPRKNPNA